MAGRFFKAGDWHLSDHAAGALAAAAAGQFHAPARYRLQFATEHLSLIAGFDELVCLDARGLRPFDYQTLASRARFLR